MKPSSRQSRAEVTLARALSKFGLASRAKAAVLIRNGHVRVNGRVVRDPNHWIDPRKARVDVDGARLVAEEFRYLAMHKPAGYVTTRDDERGRETVYALLPPGLPWMFPVGRLDKDTSGLLLFTNDVRWGEMMTAPAHHIPKTYEVTLETSVDEADLDRMRRGLTLEDGTALLPVRVRAAGTDRRKLEITLHEGKNRQIRRMMEHFRYQVIGLVRTSIGCITLRGLEPGKSRPVSREERVRLSNDRKEDGR